MAAESQELSHSDSDSEQTARSQSWTNHAELQSSASCFGYSAKMSASDILLVPRDLSNWL